MKIFSLIIGIVFLVPILYFGYTVSINRKLNLRKKEMLINNKKNFYCVLLVFSIVIFCICTSLFIFESVKDKYDPIKIINLEKDFDKINKRGNIIKKISISSAVTLLKDCDCDVEDDNYLYGVTTKKIYKVNYKTSKLQSIDTDITSQGRMIFLIDDLLVVTYANRTSSKVNVYNKNTLELIKEIICDGLIISSKAIDGKISLLCCNEKLDNVKKIGVSCNEKTYLQRLGYLKNTTISEIVSHILINPKDWSVKQKGFCVNDCYFGFGEYYYLAGNLYYDSHRQNRCFILKYNPNTLEIEKYAFFIGNIYMHPYVDETYVYMNSFDQENKSFYAYKLDKQLNVCERVKVESQDNEVLDYLLNSEKVYNLDKSLYIGSDNYSGKWKAFRDEENILVLESKNDKLNIYYYHYDLNKFDSYSVDFQEDLDKCIPLSYTKDKDEIKILFRTDEKVGYIKIDILSNNALVFARGNGCRIFITKEKVVIIENTKVQIIE